MWKTVKIGDICNLMTGGTPSREKPEYFEGGDIKWLVSGDIHQREIFDCKGRITADGYKNSNAKYLPIDSVLIALNGQGKTRGSVALLRTNATCNQSLVSIYPMKGVELDTKLLFFILDGMYGKIRRLTGDSGNERRGLNMRLVGNIEITYPTDITEQQHIVGILNRAAKIERLRARAAERLQEFIPALFIKMFGDPAENPMAEEIPTVAIGELCDLINGRAFKPTDWVDTGMPIVRIQNLKDPSKPMNKFDGQVQDRFLIDSGDILLSWSGTPGTSFGCFIWDRGRAILNQHIFRVDYDSSRIERDFFVYAMNSRLDEMIDRAHGGVGLRHITKSELNKIKLPLPPLDRQRRFAEIASKAQAAVARAETGTQTASALTASLMSRLLDI